MPSEPVDPVGGSWQEPWTPEQQQKWVSRLFAICMSKPFVESIFWTDLFDHPLADLPAAGLITDTGKPKPALARLVSLRKHLRKPLGPLKLPNRSGGAGGSVTAGGAGGVDSLENGETRNSAKYGRVDPDAATGGKR